MATALSVINSALRLTNVLADGEQPNDDVANICLGVLNDMIDAWNAERNAIFTTRSDDFPFVANKQAYTMGAGGDFNIPRPANIDSMSTILLYDPLNPVEVPIVMYTVDDWQNKLPVKVVKGTFPTICYDSGDFPLRILNFWPIPTQTASVRIYSWQALAPQTLVSQVNFPPGYAEAIRYNLADRIGDEFQRPVSSSIAVKAQLSYARIKSMNAPDLSLRSDLVSGAGAYNYRADLFGMGF